MSLNQDQVLADLSNSTSTQVQVKEVTGPQIVFDKQFLCMKSVGDEISTDQVTVRNVGTATIYYEWRKVERGDYIEAKNSDGIQRFFGITIRNKLLPKESKTFTFSFRSTKIGMFFEEWRILTEPHCLEPLPVITLNGVSIEEETELNEIDAMDAEVARVNQKNFIDEVMQDLVDRVRTPTPPLPNLLEEKEYETPEQKTEFFKNEFEKVNHKYGLYYGEYEINAFQELIYDTHLRLGTSPDQDIWDGSIDYIYNLINKVEFEISRENLLITFNRLVNNCKRMPPNRSQSYEDLREVVTNICSTLPELDESLREEIGIPEYTFEYLTDEMTEEEITTMNEEKEARKAEWMKKNKKKPKSEEEDAQDYEDLKQKISEGIKQRILEDDQVVGVVEDKIDLKVLTRFLDQHIVLTKKKWDEYYRKKSILDIG